MTGARADERAELLALLGSEIERHLARLDEHPEALAGALHALRGAAGMADEFDLQLVLTQLETATRRGESGVLGRAVPVLRDAAERLNAGLSAFPTRWPEPPRLLGVGRVPDDLRPEYQTSMRERLAELGSAIHRSGPVTDAVAAAFRSVHAMKGAAAANGDDPLTWYLHNLEPRLRAATDDAAAGELLSELPRHRAVIASLLEDPERGLVTLRAISSDRPPARRPSVVPPEDDVEEEIGFRIPAATLDDFLVRLERAELTHQDLVNTADLARRTAARLRKQRASLLEALRLIGPPRPWGAPAAALERIESVARTLGATANTAARGGARVKGVGERLGADARIAREQLARLRRTPMSRLFDNIARAVDAMADREGYSVELELSGEETIIDRRVAERLLDPTLQLARNALVHGVGKPAERTQKGMKLPGRIRLSAERVGDWLRLTVSDDGGGVDLEALRARAVERGAVGPAAAARASEEELLSLLFMPGMTTRDRADALAGRGVGLELADDAVRRLGGTVYLSGRAGSGLMATIEVPAEGGMVDVVWLHSKSGVFGLPVSFTGRVRRPSECERWVPLARCVDAGAAAHATPLAVDLQVQGVQTVSVGVDQIGEVEPANIRALPPIAAATGPYAGAIARGDGSLRLVLDPALLAARAWTIIAAAS